MKKNGTQKSQKKTSVASNKKLFDIFEYFEKRPCSWSSVSSFDYDPEAWYDNYILDIKRPDTPALIFGKTFADAAEARKPLAPVTMLSKMEQKFTVKFGKIWMTGAADTFDDVTFMHIGEYKTGEKPWTQKRVDEHGQITMYCLFNLITNKIPPEKVKLFLEWCPTRHTNDFRVELVNKKDVRHFKTKRSMKDILEFGAYINAQVLKMQEYVRARQAA